jgi:predicted PurR-regulated permease PerM
MTLPTKISYGFIALLLLLVGLLHLSTPFITVLFSYFALTKLQFGRRKQVAVALFLILVSALGFASYYFAKNAYIALPRIADDAIPVVIQFADKNGIDLPFKDYESLKNLAKETVSGKLLGVGRFAQQAVIETVFLIVGLVVAVSLFLHARFDLEHGQHPLRDNLYSLTWVEIAKRFGTFYESFSTVMGAQITISLINTLLTALFLSLNALPYASVLIAATFLCGLLPIVGNIISNTLIVGVAFTISPRLALLALVFLVVIHKLEYFLNSKIIGDRIKNPMWLTLLGLILGEKLMGLPGMILAPVVLHYIKVEALRSKVSDLTTDSSVGRKAA